MSRKIFKVFAVLALFTLVAVACGGGGTTETITIKETVIVEVPAEGSGEVTEVEVQVPVTFMGGGDTLASVQSAGVLNCGGNANLPGFGFLNEDGTFSGFDVDFCGAIAAATLGDGTAYTIRPTTATERFPVLQSGEVDVLIRNTTWTTSRDTSLGFNFSPVTFYDGQGMMVRKDSGITDLFGLEGGSVCVQAGTTTEKNLASVMRALNINVESVVFPDAPSTREAYDEGRCDGFTTDKSGLVASQTQMLVPEDHSILNATMSKEPLGPLVRHGDDNWFDIVKWTVNCTFYAEELGVTSANVDDMLGSDNPQILNLLGVEGDLGQAMGLNNDWCYQVISQYGNYAEIYDRNLGPDTPFDLPRGLNAMYLDGGLHYSPPFK